METVELKLKLPKELLSILEINGLGKEQLTKEVREVLALHLFRVRKLSFGRAAELAGLSKWEFMDRTRKEKIPLSDYTPEELEKESKAIKKLTKRLNK